MLLRAGAMVRVVELRVTVSTGGAQPHDIRHGTRIVFYRNYHSVTNTCQSVLHHVIAFCSSVITDRAPSEKNRNIMECDFPSYRSVRHHQLVPNNNYYQTDKFVGSFSTSGESEFRDTFKKKENSRWGQGEKGTKR